MLSLSVPLAVCSGPPCGLHVLEVRKTSLVLLWEPPTFNGRSPIDGYYVDIKEAAADDNSWKCVHDRSIKLKYKKVRKCRLSRPVRSVISHQ